MVWETTLLQLTTWAVLAAVAFFTIRYFLEKLTIGELKNKAVFITGCDTGFGHELAIRCAHHSMPVFAACLTQKGIDLLKKKSTGLPGNVDAFLMDVASDESVKKAAKYLEEKTKIYGGLHGIVNNAGIVGKHFSDDFLFIEDYLHVANINTWGVVRVCQQMKRLVKKTRGRIVTVASICARVGLPGIGPYTVSKYAVSGYCDTIRSELRPFGVSVHILEPGFFKTPLIDNSKIEKELHESWEKADEQVRKEYGREYFEKSIEFTAQFLDAVSSERIDWVIDAYFHALTAVFPRYRYQIGYDSTFLFIPFSFLNTTIQEYLLRILDLITPKPACAK